jgi:hypothetical protein
MLRLIERGNLMLNTKARAQAEACKREKELREVREPLWAEINLLRRLLFLEPFCHVHMLSSFSAVNPDNPFYGYWVYDRKTCEYASCGSTPDKAEFKGGFVLGHGGHHFMNGVWVGGNLKHLQEVVTTLKIDVTDSALQRLVETGVTAYFVRPDYLDVCPVYQLDDVLASMARDTGHQAEDGEEYRPAVAGDLFLVLPPRGHWEFPVRIFSPNQFPDTRYRRV